MTEPLDFAALAKRLKAVREVTEAVDAAVVAVGYERLRHESEDRLSDWSVRIVRPIGAETAFQFLCHGGLN